MLEQLIEPIVKAHGKTLWSCDVLGQGRNTILRVLIDDVTLDQCAKISREIGAVMDVEDPIQGSYQLEVSSPGIHRKLSTMAHFTRYIGAHIKAKWRLEDGEYKHGIAKIAKIEDEKIFLVMDGEETGVALSEISAASVAE